MCCFGEVNLVVSQSVNLKRFLTFSTGIIKIDRYALRRHLLLLVHSTVLAKANLDDERIPPENHGNDAAL